MLTRAFLLFSLLGCLGVPASPAEIPSSLPSTYRAFRQAGMAMEPIIGIGDVVLVDTDYFGGNQPKVGDVVLYRAKSIGNGPTVKRIVALGGGRVQLRKAKLIVDDRVIDEPYLRQGGAVTAYSQDWGPIELPSGCIILLGDYRDHSQDSRVDNCSSVDDLIGLVRYVSPSDEPERIREVK